LKSCLKGFEKKEKKKIKPSLPSLSPAVHLLSTLLFFGPHPSRPPTHLPSRPNSHRRPTSPSPLSSSRRQVGPTRQHLLLPPATSRAASPAFRTLPLTTERGIMCQRTHHAPPRRLPSRNGRPHRLRALMAPHRRSSPPPPQPPLPFLHPIKGPLEPLYLPHRTPPLLHLCRATAAETIRCRPPLITDLLRLSFRVSELWVRFLVLLASFLFLSHRVWCSEARIRVASATSAAQRRRSPSAAAAHCCQPLPAVLSVRNMVPTLTSRKRRGLSLNGRC
jgi:hypothetical protein